MAQVTMEPWAQAREVLADGTVAFTCSQDEQAWPWLALDPHHPIVIQTVTFWASYQAGQARGGWEPGQWTALTFMEWEVGKRGCGHATHGIEDLFLREGEQFFRLAFFDAQGALVAHVKGKGVVFRNRDFEGWRARAKEELGREAADDDFAFVAPEAVAAPHPGGSLLGPLRKDGSSAPALVTAGNGLPPGNPFLSGSGDHVNSTHLAEVARQFDALRQGGEQRLPKGGEMRFLHYVELGVPLEVSSARESEAPDTLAVEMRQAGRLCTTARFDY